MNLVHKRKWNILKGKIPNIKTFFLKRDGEKDVINLKRVGLFGGPILFLLILTAFVLSSNEDTSFLGQSEKRLVDAAKEPTRTELKLDHDDKRTYSDTARKILSEGKTVSKSGGRGSKDRSMQGIPSAKINFKAGQVIVRDGTSDPERSIPIGTNMIGKTLTAIDTREAGQLIKILLPYGGRSKYGTEIPKGTILFGQVVYSGRGRKVGIQITKGLFPSEQEFDINAQVLNPKNYSTGLIGDTNSESDTRVLAALGLSVASGASEIMIERETMNSLGQTIPKASLENAIKKGLSTSAQEEASRQIEFYKDTEDYITIPAGRDIIVSLTKTYVEK